MAICAEAQELSPRAYWPAPKSTKLVTAGYSFSSGDLVTDPSLPVTGVDSRLHTVQLGYRHTLGWWGRTTNLLVELPYTQGTTTGLHETTSRSVDISGTGDLAITLAINLAGAPSMTAAEFQALRLDPRSIFGASLKVMVPIGRYDGDRLLNTGANRWAFKAEVGYALPIRPRWILELEAGAWIFGDNDDFLGHTREQRPIIAGEAHMVARIWPGFWTSLDVNFFTGGRSIVDGALNADLQRNSRIGGTASYPFLRRHAVRIGYSSGLVTESGGDYSALLASYMILFR
jgi:hypothetical protein